MAIDWLALEAQWNNFKPRATDGTHKTKVTKAEVKELGSGAIAVSFTFENTDKYSLPWGTHWISTNNPGWTQWHHLQMLQVLGVNKDNAKAAIDVLYGNENLTTSTLIKGFQTMYDKAVAKHPAVEVVVRPQYNKDGTYRYNKKGEQQFESEFTDPRVYSDNKPKLVTEAPEPAPEPEPVDEEPVDLGTIPF